MGRIKAILMNYITFKIYRLFWKINNLNQIIVKRTIAADLSAYYFKETTQKIRKMIGLAPDSPYMKYKEMDLLLEILHNLKPTRCLEYGCGLSTLFFPGHLPSSVQWVSIEHHQKWYENINKSNTRNNVIINHIPKQKNNEDSFENYVNFPADQGPFDFILVDGVAREQCILKGLELLSDRGLLVIHDCNRPSYHTAIKKFPNWIILEDFRKTAGGFGFGTKSEPPTRFFDLAYHKKLWVKDTNINNFFKFKYLIGKKVKPFNVIVS